MKSIIEENIKYRMKRIIKTIAFVLFSVPIWYMLDNESYVSEAREYYNYVNENTEVSINNIENETLD